MNKKTIKKKINPGAEQAKAPTRRAPKRQALGRGLGAMLSRSQEKTAESDAASLRELPVEHIQPGQYQPRSVMDQAKLAELADSIKAQGLVQPVIVRPIAGSGAAYELIAGERRWRAAQLAGLRQIPAVIRQVSDEMTVAMALIENIQREDLNPLEEAGALQRLIDEFNMTHQQAADAVGRSRASVSNLLRLRDLPAAVCQMIDNRDLDMGHARALLALPVGKQVTASQTVVKLGLSVRATEQLVRKLLAEDNNAGQVHKVATQADPNIIRLEHDLSDQMGAEVIIKQQSKGRGEVRIRYSSLDELEGILEHIQK